jgi:hypothetical protein
VGFGDAALPLAGGVEGPFKRNLAGGYDQIRHRSGRGLKPERQRKIAEHRCIQVESFGGARPNS